MGSWVAACRLLPSLATRKGFAQAPAVARCPKNQQLYLFILRGYAFIIPFTCLVCEPLGRTSLIWPIKFSLQPLLITSDENWDHPLTSGLEEGDLKQPFKCHKTCDWITNTNASHYRAGCKIQAAICTISLVLSRYHPSAKVTHQAVTISSPVNTPALYTLLPTCTQLLNCCLLGLWGYEYASARQKGCQNNTSSFSHASQTPVCLWPAKSCCWWWSEAFVTSYFWESLQTALAFQRGATWGGCWSLAPQRLLPGYKALRDSRRTWCAWIAK